MRARLSDSPTPSVINTYVFSGSLPDLERLIQWFLTHIDGLKEDARFVKAGKRAKTLKVVIGDSVKLTQTQVMLFDSICLLIKYRKKMQMVK